MRIGRWIIIGAEEDTIEVDCLAVNMSILLCQREDGAYVSKMSVDFPDEIREEDDEQESQGKGKVAPAQCSGRKHYCCEQGNGEQERDWMHLEEDAEQ